VVNFCWFIAFHGSNEVNRVYYIGSLLNCVDQKLSGQQATDKLSFFLGISFEAKCYLFAGSLTGHAAVCLCGPIGLYSSACNGCRLFGSCILQDSLHFHCSNTENAIKAIFSNSNLRQAPTVHQLQAKKGVLTKL
jgi:hypothetical protein